MNRRHHGNSLPAGHRLREYRIESVLGQGGFGITYLAFDTGLDRKVAIKEYLPVDLAVREDDSTVRPFTEDRAKLFEWGLDRFLAEARTLARLDHPNIVRVHAVFEAHGTAYMVMPFETGRSFADLIRFGGAGDEASLLRILHALLDGLEHVHSTGFLHRDIKPDNVFVRTDGSPVLLDFGSARVGMGTQARSQMTSVVSPGFAPYEQYHGDASRQGPWTDIYGLGATFYAAVSRGRPPLDSLVRGDAHIEGRPDPIEPAAAIAREHYSESLLAAIDAALRFRIEERPQSIAAWRAMLPPRPASATGGAASNPGPIPDATPNAASAPGSRAAATVDLAEAVTVPRFAGTASPGPAGAIRADVEGYGAGEPESASEYLVLGLLSFWTWTALRARDRLRAHAADREAWFLARLPQACERPEAAALLGDAFRTSFAPARFFAGLYALDGVAVACGFVWLVVLGADWTLTAKLLATGAASLLFYANTVAFVMWFWRTLRRHEHAELKLLELAGEPASFSARRAIPGFAARWEPVDNRVILFLVLSGPIAFSPTVGLNLFHGGLSFAATLALPIAVFACAGVFHLWGTKLLLALWNGHLRHEAHELNARPRAVAAPR